jgi:hypothetical protein
MVKSGHFPLVYTNEKKSESSIVTFTSGVVKSEKIDLFSVANRVNRTVGGPVPTVQKYRPVNRSNRPVYWEVKIVGTD